MMSDTLRWFVDPTTGGAEVHAVRPAHDIALCGVMKPWLKPVGNWQYWRCLTCLEREATRHPKAAA